jgi:microcystin-dependent protein
MEGYIGEIRGFAGNYVPESWMACEGQVLQVNQNQALFSIIGKTYGGNGTTNFQLPDLRGRVPIGAGQGPGLTYYPLGTATGAENRTLVLNNLPAHNHPATTSGMTVTGTATGNITPKCCEEGGDNSNAVGNALASITNGYVSASDATGNMAPIAASLTLNGTVSGAVAIGNSGSSQPFSIVQPVLAIRWIICIYGIYPPRS